MLSPSRVNAHSIACKGSRRIRLIGQSGFLKEKTHTTEVPLCIFPVSRNVTKPLLVEELTKPLNYGRCRTTCARRKGFNRSFWHCKMTETTVIDADVTKNVVLTALDEQSS